MSIIWYHVLKNPWNNTLLGIYPSLNFPCVLVFFICLSSTMWSLLNIGWYIYFFIPVFHSDSSTNSFWLFFFFSIQENNVASITIWWWKENPVIPLHFLCTQTLVNTTKDWVEIDSLVLLMVVEFDITLMLVITSFFPPFEFKPMSGVSKTTKKGSASSS